ncbi:hypothetical protein [Rouxiella chamberiensis]|uniref:Uncharacterized protein n=1 Tax=Rouxiella chamberiensis TaxID=1513468 RepID=A0ABY7HQM8_9GAMM|nr:hypothetical protein [Rouxiella chamberiensis]WAT01698.1 hypothetical protein O1V66_02825 [Rouxiella chamberiensis]
MQDVGRTWFSGFGRTKRSDLRSFSPILAIKSDYWNTSRISLDFLVA